MRKFNLEFLMKWFWKQLLEHSIEFRFIYIVFVQSVESLRGDSTHMTSRSGIHTRTLCMFTRFGSLLHQTTRVHVRRWKSYYLHVNRYLTVLGQCVTWKSEKVIKKSFWSSTTCGGDDLNVHDDSVWLNVWLNTSSGRCRPKNTIMCREIPFWEVRSVIDRWFPPAW